MTDILALLRCPDTSPSETAFWKSAESELKLWLRSQRRPPYLPESLVLPAPAAPRGPGSEAKDQLGKIFAVEATGASAL